MKTSATLIALFILSSNLKAETSLVGFKKDPYSPDMGTKGSTSLVGFKKEEFTKKNNSIPFYVQGTEKAIEYKIGGFHSEDFVSDTLANLKAQRIVGCEQKAAGASADGFDRNMTLLNAPFVKLNCDSVEALKNSKQLKSRYLLRTCWLFKEQS